MTGHPFAERWNHNTHHYPLLRSLIPSAARRHLDVGCGEGTLCRYVADTGRAVAGVDIDPHVLPRAADGSGTRYAAASAESLPFGDGTFDAASMVMVLHHTEAERALAEVTRVLAPGAPCSCSGWVASGAGATCRTRSVTC